MDIRKTSFVTVFEDAKLHPSLTFFSASLEAPLLTPFPSLAMEKQLEVLKRNQRDE